MSKGYIHSYKEFRANDDGTMTIQAIPLGNWKHPVYGDVAVDMDLLNELKRSYDERTYGQDLFINYDHTKDAAKGNKAAAKIIGVELDSQLGMVFHVQPTPTAKKEIEEGEWNYFSPEWFDEWPDPNNGVVHKNVLRGGGLTNYPYMKGILPINMSELVLRADENVGVHEGAKSNTQVPASTEPEPGTTLVLGVQANAEGVRFSPKEPTPLDQMDMRGSNVQFSEVIVDEKELRNALGLGDEDDLSAALTAFVNDAKAYRDLKNTTSEKKEFAETHPDLWREIQEGRKFRAELAAREFSDSFKLDNGKTLSPVAKDKLKAMHIEMSEGSLTPQLFSESVQAILKDGIVDLTETGSSTTHEAHYAEGHEAAKLFSEKIVQIQINDQVDFDTATQLAAGKHPELFTAYREYVAAPQRS